MAGEIRALQQMRRDARQALLQSGGESVPLRARLQYSWRALRGEANDGLTLVNRMANALDPFGRGFSQKIAGLTFNGKRDMYGVLGYDDLITNLQYRLKYQRGGLAGRIVDVMPDAAWRGTPAFTIQEDKDAENDTAFEKAWKDFDRRLQVTPKFHRVNKLARLTSFAVLLIGEQGGQLDQELPKGNGKGDGIIFLKPYSGGGGPNYNPTRHATIADYADASVYQYDLDTTSPRYGEPLLYTIKHTSMAESFVGGDAVHGMQTIVHWTRVIHVAEGLLEDEVFGTPALERVWNLLIDLEKVTGGGAEAFWLRANQGLHLDIDKELVLKDVPDTIQALKDQSDQYRHQQTRWLRTRGVNVKTLGSDVAEFGNNSDAIITQIAGAKAIPKRVLTGSELGQLASSQDRENFKDQVDGYRTQVCAGWVRQFIGRLIDYNYLPMPVEGPDAYYVGWPNMQVLTEDEKAAGAAKWAAVNQAMGEIVFTADEIRQHWYGMGEGGTDITEPWRAALALKMALTNKTQGITIFTDDEIRATAYVDTPLAKPLTPDQKLPITAPEKVSAVPSDAGVVAPPKGTPGQPPQPAQPAPKGAVPPQLKVAEAALVEHLTSAIESGDEEAIMRALGLRAAASLSSTQVQLPEPIRSAVLAFQNQINPFKLDDSVKPSPLEDDPHITVLYGLTNDDPGDVADLLSEQGPVTFKLGPLDHFELPDHDVLYASVASDDLMALNDYMTQSLDFQNGHPQYVPHVTIAYLKKGTAKMYDGDTTLADLTATVNEVRFSTPAGVKKDLPLGLRSAGDMPGHDFHGNQYSEAASAHDEAAKAHESAAATGLGHEHADVMSSRADDKTQKTTNQAAKTASYKAGLASNYVMDAQEKGHPNYGNQKSAAEGHKEAAFFHKQAATALRSRGGVK